MSKTRIYTAQPLALGQTISLEEKASQHLLRVLRAERDDAVIIFNGQGGEFHGTIVEAKKSRAVIQLDRFDDAHRESPIAIHLMQGISRGERMDYVVQKAVELGVSCITPLFTERCTVKLSDERLSKRLAHWQGIAIAAAEQAGRTRVPEINAAIRFADVLAIDQGVGFICDTAAHSTIHEYPMLEGAISVLIGPEGGFAEHERQGALKKGFYPLSLGPRILRTETAPVVVMTLLQAHGGDL